LSFETAGQLYRLGMQLLAVQPWEFLEDQDLILMQDGESGEICYCSTMGPSRSISLQVYTGAESYRFFEELQRESLPQPEIFTVRCGAFLLNLSPRASKPRQT